MTLATVRPGPRKGVYNILIETLNPERYMWLYTELGYEPLAVSKVQGVYVKQVTWRKLWSEIENLEKRGVEVVVSPRLKHVYRKWVLRRFTENVRRLIPE